MTSLEENWISDNFEHVNFRWLKKSERKREHVEKKKAKDFDDAIMASSLLSVHKLQQPKYQTIVLKWGF